MKSEQKWLHAAAIGGMACALIIGSGLCSSSVGSYEPGDNALAFSIPDVPEYVTFSGEKINLDRYDLYERFERELTSTCYMHSTTLLTLKRANRVMPEIEPILQKEGIPTDFVYLAAIESHFNPRAYSSAKAAGIWQFMPKTAKEYGLEVNEYVDERYNIEKATRAACRYLKNAHKKYGNWVSTAASYNAGMGRISTELARQGESNALDLLLTEETSRYVFRILAMKQVMASPAKYGFVLKAKQLYQPIATTTLEVDTPIVNLADFAKRHGTTYMQLKEFNPWLRARELPNKIGKLYKIKIPVKKEMYYTKGRHYKSYRPEWVVK